MLSGDVRVDDQVLLRWEALNMQVSGLLGTEYACNAWTTDQLVATFTVWHRPQRGPLQLAALVLKQCRRLRLVSAPE